jgi:error-prone DNA polymerase
VLQWDKDDCAAAGLVKFDLLGLGMLTALHYAVDHIHEHRGYEVDLATCPRRTTSTTCCAGRLGRGVPGGVPGPDGHPARLQPRCFYDLVVEVALIRPGPIQGGSVHPYIRRRRGEEPVTYLHPLLRERRSPRPWACRCSRSS